jgi:hypothetical protein
MGLHDNTCSRPPGVCMHAEFQNEFTRSIVSFDFPDSCFRKIKVVAKLLPPVSQFVISSKYVKKGTVSTLESELSRNVEALSSGSLHASSSPCNCMSKSPLSIGRQEKSIKSAMCYAMARLWSARAVMSALGALLVVSSGAVSAAVMRDVEGMRAVVASSEPLVLAVTDEPHGVSVRFATYTLTAEVGSDSSFRLGVRFNRAPTAPIVSPSLDAKRNMANFTRVNDNGMHGVCRSCVHACLSPTNVSTSKAYLFPASTFHRHVYYQY